MLAGGVRKIWESVSRCHPLTLPLETMRKHHESEGQRTEQRRIAGVKLPKGMPINTNAKQC